jgi:hypothetical protein
LKAKFLFLFEPTSIEAFLKKASNPLYSHDLNLMQLAQGAILNEHSVMIASYADVNNFYISQTYWPNINLEQVDDPIAQISDFDFIISANHLAFINSNRRGAKNVLVQAAVHLIESPKLYYPNGTASYINVIRNSIDFIITQNSRMREILSNLFMLLAGFNDPQRILVSKLSPKNEVVQKSREERERIRENLGIGTSDIVLVNAGGAWKWTQFNELLIAFNDFCKLNKESKIHLIQPSLSQSENLDHIKYHRETTRILNSMSSEVRAQIHIGNDWQDGNAKLQEYLAIADYGINLNLDTLEQWQSYRVRTLEYIANEIPILISKGSFWDNNENQNAFMFVGHSIRDLTEAIVTISNEQHESYLQRKIAVRQIASELHLDNQARKTINDLVTHQLLGTTVELAPEVIWDFSYQGPRSRIRVKRIAKYIYIVTTQNRFVHSFLVKIGIRKIYRYIKELS